MYEEYRCFCQSNNFDPLCVADFGKAMKHVFPLVKPRRLGQRGNSKYCYSGLRKRLNLVSPHLPDLSQNNISDGAEERKDLVEPSYDLNLSESSHHHRHQILFTAASRLTLEWAEKILETSFQSIIDLGKYLLDCDLVDTGSLAALKLISSLDDKSSILSFGKTSVNEKKSEDEFTLQKKLLQKGSNKDQKKAKSETVKACSNHFYTFGSSCVGRASRKESKKESIKMNASLTLNSSIKEVNPLMSEDNLDLALPIQVPTDDGHSAKTGSIFQSTTPQNKVMFA